MNYGSNDAPYVFVPFDRLYTFQGTVYRSKVDLYKSLLKDGIDLGRPTAIEYNPHNGEKGCFALTQGNHRSVAWHELGAEGVYVEMDYPQSAPPRNLRKLKRIQVDDDRCSARRVGWVKWI